MPQWTTNLAKLYREAYSDHPSQVWVLTILTFINRLGTMVMPFLTVYLTTALSFTLTEAGILSGSYGFGAMLGAYLSGKSSDKFGGRITIIVSLFVAGILMIFLQWVTAFIGLLGLLLVAGMFAEAYRPAVMASMGALVSTENSGRTMALMRLAISLGMSMAPTIGGIIAVSYGYSWLFWVDGLTCIAASFYYMILSKPNTQGNESQAKPSLAKEKVTSLRPYQDRKYSVFLLATFLAGFSFMQWFGTVPVFIKSSWSFDESYIGLMMGVSSILNALFEMPTVHFLEKQKKTSTATKVGLLMIGASFMPFLLPASIWFYLLAVIIWTTGAILFLSFNNAMPLKMCDESNRGDYLGWYWMTWALCAILAPVIGMWIVEVLGYQMLWFILGLFVIAGILLGQVFHRNNK